MTASAKPTSPAHSQWELARLRGCRVLVQEVLIKLERRTAQLGGAALVVLLAAFIAAIHGHYSLAGLFLVGMLGLIAVAHANSLQVRSWRKIATRLSTRINELVEAEEPERHLTAMSTPLPGSVEPVSRVNVLTSGTN